MSDVNVVGADTGSAPPPSIDVKPPTVGADPPAQLSMDDTLLAAWDKAQTGVDRAEDGKFTNGKAAETAPAVETNSAVQPPKAEVEPAKPAIDPPNSWTAEARAYWPTLSPEAQQYIAQRESEAHKAITSYGERLKSYEPVEQTLSRYQADINRRGISAPQALSVLFEAQRQLDADLDGGLISIGKTYGKSEVDLAAGILARAGIDLRSLLTGQQGGPPIADPRLGQVTQKLSELEQQIERQRQADEQRLSDEAEAMLKDFAKDKPHFEDVRKLMSSFMKDGHAQSLQDAYDMAVNASPQVRARIQADQRAAEEKKRQGEAKAAEEEAKRKAADALKSSKVNVRGSSAHPNPKSMDDTLNEIARRAYG